MLIYLSLLFPILAIITHLILHKKIFQWEIVALVSLLIISIIVTKTLDEYSQTKDVEYIQDYVVRVEYYEDWNEWIEKTCSKEKCTGSGKDEKCETEYYDCSYVDYHEEYWVIITASGNQHYIDKNEWDKLKKQFNTNPIFVDMQRDYYTDDGDMYYYIWDGDIKSVEYLVTTHNYENRVQASHNVVNFQEVHSLIGDNNSEIDDYINKTNALYAIKKQVKVFYLIFKNKPLDAALLQEQYWKGGNKNEIIICVGIDDNRFIKWSYVFSWSKSENVKIAIRDYIIKQRTLDKTVYKNIVDYSNKEIIKNYTRFRFKEFSYLSVDLSNSAIVIAFIISFIVSLIFIIYVLKNQ